ncbi:MAG: glycoside hydrolase family 88 protein [Bacteroidota bacterium]
MSFPYAAMSHSLKRNIAFCFFSLAILFSCTPSRFSKAPNTFNAAVLLKESEKKVKLLVDNLNDTTFYPRNLKPNGEVGLSKRASWTVGFFPGILWNMYMQTGKESWRKEAIKWNAALASNATLRWRTHDLGFMMFNSFGKAYEATHEPIYRDIVLQCADSLALMYNENVGTTESWPWRKEWDHPTIIDNMLNIELLFWAAKNGGNPAYYQIAEKHAFTTLKNHVRDDYTTWHVVDFDSETGVVKGKYTDQGLADSSTWARGQAWAIYGYVMTYRETGNKTFLTAAKKLTKAYIDKLPKDFIPFWDLDLPHNQNEVKDASAACITASALLELATMVEEKERAYYSKLALKTLTQLRNNHFNESEDVPFLIKNCTGSKPHNSEINTSLIYADYYFIEALMRLQKIESIQVHNAGK